MKNKRGKNPVNVENKRGAEWQQPNVASDYRVLLMALPELDIVIFDIGNKNADSTIP